MREVTAGPQIAFDVPTICGYNGPVRFDWDEAKRRANLRKHGIDFLDVPAIFAGDTVTVPDDRFDYAETRHVTLGLLRDRVIVVAHTRIRRQNPYHLCQKGYQG